MQLVVPIAVTAADAAAIKILSRISPHDVFFILLHTSSFLNLSICTQRHKDAESKCSQFFTLFIYRRFL